MDNYRAVALAEGFEDGTEEEQVEAWQHLVDTGLAWTLQGSFGRTAASMIETGVINAPSIMDPNAVTVSDDEYMVTGLKYNRPSRVVKFPSRIVKFPDRS